MGTPIHQLLAIALSFAMILISSPSSLLAQDTQLSNAEISQIVEIIADGCHCKSDGRGCDSTGVYVAPFGFSIVNVKPAARTKKTGTFKITGRTQPNYILAKNITTTDVSALIGEMAKESKDTNTEARLLAIASAVNTLRVIESASYAVIKSQCHTNNPLNYAKDHHRTKPVRDAPPVSFARGEIFVKWNLQLLRQPTVDDFKKVVVEIIKYSQDQSDDHFIKSVETLEKMIAANPV